MSYNNYSYYNGPPSSNDWWPTKETPTPTFEEERLKQKGFSSQPLSQNYGRGIVQPNEIATNRIENRSFDATQFRHESRSFDAVSRQDNRSLEPALIRHENRSFDATTLRQENRSFDSASVRLENRSMEGTLKRQDSRSFDSAKLRQDNNTFDAHQFRQENRSFDPNLHRQESRPLDSTPHRQDIRSDNRSFDSTPLRQETRSNEIAPSRHDNRASDVTQARLETRATEPPQIRHEVIQGAVTQLFSNFGYINQNIIFSKSDVIGQMVKIGDKVSVDATFQPNNPTKYKGEHVRKIEDAPPTVTQSTLINKIVSLAQASTTTASKPASAPTKNRWDVKQVTQNVAPARILESAKSIMEKATKNANQVHTVLPVKELPAKIVLETKSANQGFPARIDLTQPGTNISNVRTNIQSMTMRSDHLTNTDTNSLLTRIDLTKTDDPPRKSPADKKRLDEQVSTTRPSISIKSRLDMSSRSEEHTSSRKRSSHSKEKRSRSRDRSTEARDKSRHNEPKAKKPKPRKSQPLRKLEVAKRKAISPIKFQISSSKDTNKTIKRSSESKNKGVFKNYESFSYCELDCAAIKNQFRTLALPSAFFHVSLKYQQSFPLNHPMKLGNNCHFKIMDKKVRSIDSVIEKQLNADIDPEDADTTFVAKVMLLSTDDLAKFYKDTLVLAEEFDGENKIPITKAIKFLVGSFGEDKEFGIGGAWSPSLDGADPDTNPQVLINTAIRTCRAITGIDLSNCSAWPKFLELHYYRSGQNKTVHSTTSVSYADEGIREPRMETVIYYIPDVWNLVPSLTGWTEIAGLYREQLTCLMCPPPVIPIRAVDPSPASATSSKPITSPTISTTASAGINMEVKEMINGVEQEEEDWNETESSNDSPPTNPDNTTSLEAQPTHYSKLVVSKMKIVDIKKELELRNMNNRGVMEQLKARLKAALDREEANEKNKDNPTTATPAAVIQTISKSVLSEEQKNELKKLYTLPDQPHIIVHQNRKIFGDQMKIKTMSLHSLLSYYNVKLQESTFELAIFAKQFLDMLRRDAVFNIYKSIVMAPEVDLLHIDETAKKAKLMVTTSKRTVNRPLLFSCALLDREKTNKISLDDLKILIEGLGISLSTNQLLAVLEKVKDKSKFFNYRQLTDKEMTDADITNMLNAEESEDLDYIKELAMGNKALFDSENIQIDSRICEEELERLRNELDKSERCRQSIELKVSELKEETRKKMAVSEAQTNEILKLKEQVSEYKSKYRSEQVRNDRYKGDYDNLFRQLKDIDIMTTNLNKCVTETLNKHKKSDIKERSSVTDSKKISSEKTKKTADVHVDLTTSSAEEYNDKSLDVDDISAYDDEDMGRTMEVDIGEEVNVGEEIEDSALFEEAILADAAEMVEETEEVGETGIAEKTVAVCEVGLSEETEVVGEVDTVEETGAVEEVEVAQESELMKETEVGEEGNAANEAEVVEEVNEHEEIHSTTNVSDEVTNHNIDEFELSKPFDYDMISLDDIDI